MSLWLYKFIYLQMWNVLHVTHLFTPCRPKVNELTILTVSCSFLSYFIDSGDRSLVIPTQDIVLSTCEVTFKPQPCTRHDCGSEIVSIMAVSDFIDDGDRMTMILTKPAVSQSSVWKSHDPPDAIVSDLAFKILASIPSSTMPLRFHGAWILILRLNWTQSRLCVVSNFRGGGEKRETARRHDVFFPEIRKYSLFRLNPLCFDWGLISAVISACYFDSEVYFRLKNRFVLL